MERINIYKQGDVYLVKIYYPHINQSKIRPVAIVSNEKAIDIDVIISPITGQAPRNDFDVVINKWQEAGLERPSIARTSKLMTINNTMLYKRLGELDSGDLENILQKCRECF